MKKEIGSWVVWLLLIADVFLWWSIRHFNASAIDTDDFWYTFSILLCNRISLLWVGVLIACLFSIRLKKWEMIIFMLYVGFVIYHTINWALHVL